MLHIFVALVEGVAAMLLVTGAFRLAFTRWIPAWAHNQIKPRPGHVYADLGSSLLAATAGGYVSAWASAGDPLRAVLALGVVALVLGGVSALDSRGKQPIWYQLALTAVLPLGVAAGGLARLHWLGVF
jgi:hypothetical protein